MADTSLADAEASGIYQIRNLINGKCYIGSAACFRVRWNAHRMRLRRGDHHSRHLQSAWTKYGEQAFAFEILEWCDKDDLISKEQVALDTLRPGYNICRMAGNTTGVLKSPETREKIRRKAVGRKMPERGPEYRAKLSQIHAGKQKPAHVMEALQAGRARSVFTEERRASVAMALRDSYANGTRSRERPEEYRNKIGRAFAKLSDAQVREIRELRSAGVSGSELAERYDSNAGTISAICNGKRYRWVA